MNYPVLALIIANIIWGAASPIFKFALQNIPPFTLGFVRFFVAGLLFVPFAYTHWQRMTMRDYIGIILSSFFGIFLHISLFFMGLRQTASIYAPIMLSSAPIALFAYSVIFLKEKPQKKVGIGMTVSIAGVLLVAVSPLVVTGGEDQGSVLGNLYFFLSMIGGMIIKPIINKKTLIRIHVFQVTCLEFLCGAFMFLPFMLKEMTLWSFDKLTVNGWVGILYGVFFSSALAYILFNWGISKIATQELGIFYYIDPVVALFVAALLLGESPTLYYIVGTLFIFFGIFIAEKRLHYHPFHRLKKKADI